MPERWMLARQTQQRLMQRRLMRPNPCSMLHCLTRALAVRAAPPKVKPVSAAARRQLAGKAELKTKLGRVVRMLREQVAKLPGPSQLARAAVSAVAALLSRQRLARAGLVDAFGLGMVTTSRGSHGG